MKILICLPDGRIHKLRTPFIDISFREAPLTATYLAGFIPKELNVNIKIVDESIQKLELNEDFDLVAISVLTGTAKRAYEIADHFKKKGSTIILGGIHVTLMPDEAKKYADTIVTGFAERSWPQLLLDFKNNQLKEIYRQEDYENKNENILDSIPPVKRELQKSLSYMIPYSTFATRGCRNKCDFCSVPAAKFGWSKRNIDDIYKEIKTFKRKHFTFNDVNLLDDVEYAKKLLKKITPLKKKWGGLATVNVVDDDELLSLLQESGCTYLLIGFESVSASSIKGIGKGFNKVEKYKEVVQKLHSKNIIIQGCFIFGLDNDDKNVFKNTVNLVNKLKIDIPRYAIYTPYPKTLAYIRLEKEDRLLHEKWEHYDTQHVVFKPKLMTPKELDDGFKWAYKETFSLKSNLSRTLSSGKNFPVTFIGNLAYKLYIKRLVNEKNRIYYE